MANARKKISELTTLTSASLDTLVVGVDNGTTYKIELDVLADAVTSRVNILDRDRLSSLESVTSSFETKGRNLISSSAQISSLGFISNSVDISSLNAFTSSQTTLNTAFTNGINSRLQTSSFNTFSASVHSEIIAATNEQSFNGLISGSSQLTSSYDERYTLSGSVQPLPAGLISGSSQIDITSTTGFTSYSSSVDGRIIYEKERIDAILSGSSINYDTLKEIVDLVNLGTGSYETVGRGIISSSAQLPTGLLSGSSQLTSSFDSRYTLSGSSVSIETGSFATTGSNTFKGETVFQDKVTINHDLIVTGSSLFGSGSFDEIAPEKFLVVQDNPNNYNIIVAKANTNNYSQIVVTNLNNGISASSDLIVQADNGGETNMYADLGVNSSGYTGNGNGIGAANDAYVYGKAKDFWVGNLTTSSLYIFANPNGTADIILSSSVLTVSGSLLVSGNITGDLDYSNLINVPSLISASSQLTSSYDNRYAFSGSLGIVPSGTISGSSQLTSSFDLRYALSGSGGTTEIPAGTISGSQQITSFGFVSTSVDISSLNNFTASYNTDSSSFKTSILNLENNTSSYETTGRGILSGSISYGSLINVPTGIVSGAIQLYSSFAQLNNNNSFIGNQEITGALYVSNGISASSITVTTFYAVSSSVASTSGSTSFGSLNSDFMNVTGSLNVTNTISASSFNGLGNLTEYSSSIENKFISDRNRLTSLENSTSSFESKGRNIISGSSQLTSSFDIRYTLSGSVQPLPVGTISGSSQLTSSFDIRYTLSGSVSAVPSGTISGSSQLTASFDTRYALSGSSGGTIPTGTVSGSSQLTSSYDLRYLLTGSVTSSILQLNTFTASNANTSLNSFTSSLNIWSGSIATTGSNSFNGNQNITGSLTVTSGTVVASQITANTSSLYLTSGSNLYIQNTGIAEISGSLKVSGSVAFTGSVSISSGSITMPNRPAFRVVGTASTERAVGLILSGSAVSVDYNEGGYFNTTNGKFTAPIAGLYNVYYNGRVGATNSAMQVIVYKNTNIVQLMWEAAGNTGGTHFGVSGIVKLAANDTLETKVTVGSIQFDGNDSFGATYIG